MDQSPKSERTQPESISAQIPTRRKKFGKLKEGINKLPDKKPHLDFLAGLLTIPLLIVTLILNINNLAGKNASLKTSPTPSPAPTIIYRSASSGNVTPLVVTSKPQPTDSSACIKDIGPISISYPTDGQTVSDNPVCIGIDYQAGNYCSVVWSYQINGSNASDYSNTSVCLYNLPPGTNTFVLHVKSLSSPSVKTLTRTFTYKNTMLTPTLSATPTNTPAPSISAIPTQ